MTTSAIAKIDDNTIDAKLGDLARFFNSREVLVAVCDGDIQTFASAGTHRNLGFPSSEVSRPLHCLSKLFTVGLVNRIVCEQRLAWDTQILKHLGAASKSTASILRGITVKNLVEHTHGLDAASLDVVPIEASGLIDVEALLVAISQSEPLATPGTIYNYSNIGYWLVGACLERIRGKSFQDLLREQGRAFHVLSGATGDLDVDEAVTCCPATGGKLGTPLRELLAFLQDQFSDRNGTIFSGRDLSEVCCNVVSLPGWNPLETGIYFGWKHYRGGWFGHNARSANSTALVRVHPELRKAVVVWSQDHSAVLIGAALFADLLPEFQRFRMPQIRRDSSLTPDYQAAIEGVYADSATEIEVRAEGAELQVSAYRRVGLMREPQAFLSAALRQASDGVFLTHPLELDQFAFLQFLESAEGKFEYLWNGRSVWRRKRTPRLG